jgi:hypothetical protein
MTLKPTEHRINEYFAQIEKELKKQTGENNKKQTPKDEKDKIRELHFMKCPKCGIDLIEIDFKDIKIDECSSCRGMWLDAGEFDALAKIEKPVLERLFNVFKK